MIRQPVEPPHMWCSGYEAVSFKTEWKPPKPEVHDYEWFKRQEDLAVRKANFRAFWWVALAAISIGAIALSV